MKLLEGKTAIITGASRGIGKAVALEFARQGANIAFTDLRYDEIAQETEKEIAALGVKAKMFASNAADFAATNATVDEIVKEFGRVDILVNNAGIVRDEFLLMMSSQTLDDCFQLNVKGYFYCAQQAALKMFRKKAGVIINMSSVSGKFSLPGQSVYSATKGAVNSMTQTLAKELAPYGIRVNAVAPGFIETEMLDHIPVEKKEEYLKNIPLHKLGRTEDVANLVSFLASDASAYITGQTITLDGGLSL